MMKRLCYLFLLLAAGCAALGLPTPEKFNERLAAAYVTATAIVDGTRIVLATKKITPDDAQNILKQTDNLVAALDVARSMSRSDPVAANTKLSATVTALTALQAYLASKEKQ
jgi:hypothetical protein